jgi:hypothetical protein
VFLFAAQKSEQQKQPKSQKQKKTEKEKETTTVQKTQQKYAEPMKPYIISSPPLSGEWLLASDPSPVLPILDIRQMNNTEWRRLGFAKKVRNRSVS